MSEAVAVIENPAVATPVMNPVAKAAILALMRDPATIQVREWLYNGQNGYCPVGLICEAYRRATGKGQWVWGLFDWRQGRYKPDADSRLVERWSFDSGGKMELFKWLGLLPSQFKIEFEGTSYGPELLGYKTDFKTLADLIEKQF